MGIVSFYNPRYSAQDHSSIDIDAVIEGIEGVVPFTATPDMEIFEELVAAGPAAYVPEAPEPTVYAPLSARQLRLGLLKIGISPDQVDTAIDRLPADQKVTAKIEWDYASEYKRDHYLIALLGASFGLTEEQINEAWLVAQSL